MPAKGSSRSMIEGSAASARAISQRRRSPPERAIAGEFAKGSEPEFAKELLEPRLASFLVRLAGLEHGQDVFLDRHSAENRCFLRKIAKTEDCPPVHRQLGDVLAVEIDEAAVGLHEPHDRIEAGRLAGAVRAQQPDDLASVDLEADVMEDRALVIGFGDRAHFEPAVQRPRLGGATGNRGGLVHCFVWFCWCCGTVKWPVTRPPLELTPGGPPSTTARPEVEVDHQPRAVHLVVLAVELDVADAA